MEPSPKCAHTTLLTRPSSYAHIVGYKPYIPQQLFTAATGSRKRIKLHDGGQNAADIFPAPLILPGDELALDPKSPPQSFKSWLNEDERNQVTEDRKTVYVAAAPIIASSMLSAMESWDVPRSNAVNGARLIGKPDISDIVTYLQAFFHGLPVKQLPQHLEFTEWTSRRKPKSTAKDKTSPLEYIGCRSVETDLITRVKVRHLGKLDDFSPYAHQLNLNDMLDHAISILPKDAYCLILLADHDLYEDEDDDFACGRAYGGSRIAVVSNAQYQPALHSWHRIDVSAGHWWPGSHCEEFVKQECDKVQRKERSSSKQSIKNCHTSKGPPVEQLHCRGLPLPDDIVKDSLVVDVGSIAATPLQAALATHVDNISKSTMSEDDLGSLYLHRITLTASHELLHCFGMDHCVYSACAMQGTASMIEDTRQPPLLCQVCESKLARAIVDKSHPSWSKSSKDGSDQQWWESQDILKWRRARHEQLLQFCQGRGNSDLGFGSLGAWTQKYLNLTG